MQQPDWKTLLAEERFRSVVSGSCAGLVAALVTCPIDMVKIRMQNVADKGLGSVATLRNILMAEGVKGVYKGVGVTAMSYLPNWAIYFSVYDASKSFYSQNFSVLSPSFAHLLSAVQAGVTSAVITNPLFVVRTRIMTQPSSYSPFAPYYYRSTLDGLVTLARKEGVQALYKGIGPTLLGVSHVAIQFPLYEQFKRYLARDNDPSRMDSRSILLASAAAKLIASSITYPHEVIRTRLQTQTKVHVEAHSTPTCGQLAHSRSLSTRASSAPKEHRARPHYRGLVHAGKVIFRNEGLRGFYKGFYASLFRNIPAAAMTIFTYEFLSNTMVRLSHQ
ncbi:mitochondrial carrier domain-containing protein [Gorgonomyces haynaldii]|nr:mitochondrial carrier domain-containing protein [Gorgonomyces haynaldii]